MSNGTVWKFGENINTDEIIPARHLNTSDHAELAKHCMEDADETFAEKVKTGDYIVAGKNFGCGSSREHAPIAIKAAGVAGVIAPSFARIFFRNAINMGLPIFESKEAAEALENGDHVEIDINNGKINSGDKTFTFNPYPKEIQEIITSGGLISHVRNKLERTEK